MKQNIIITLENIDDKMKCLAKYWKKKNAMFFAVIKTSGIYKLHNETIVTFCIENALYSNFDKCIARKK